MWKLFLFGALLCWTSFLFGFTNEISQYSSSIWQTEDGLPHSSISAIAQTRDGYLWLATKERLTRFDGNRFVVVDSSYLPKIQNHSFTALFESRDGTLWMASEDGKLYALQNGKSSELPLPASVAHCFLTTIFQSKDGSLWVGTDTNGLIRFKNGKFSQLTLNEGLAHNSVRSICEDDAGNLWIATAAGVNRWKDGNIATFNNENGLLHNSTRVVCFDRKGNLWVASHFGLTRIKDGKSTHFKKKDGLSDNLISAIFEDQQGVLWIGTFNGLNRMVDGKLFTETRSDGTSYDRVNAIIEDREGNLWVGTRDGLSRLKPRVVTAYTQQNGLTHNNATALLEDSAGDLWVSFWGGGVNRIHEGRITAYTTREGLSSDLLLTLHQSRSGDMWIGMDYDGGLNRLAGNQFVHYREPEGLKDHAIKVIQDDSRGNLWIGTRTALLSFRDEKFTRYTARDGLPSEIIEAIHEDRRGRLWFGTTGGLAFFENEKFISFTTQNGLSHNSVTSIYEDRDGTLWLGTRGGLNRFRDGKFTVYTTSDGLFRDEIFAVLEDDLGFLWMSSRQGIFRASKKELNNFVRGESGNITCISFGKSDGMVSVECKGSGKTAGWKTRDGRLWFPTSKGIVAVDPRNVKVNSQPPLIAIEELLVNGKPADISTAVQLVAGNQELVFRYTALSFSAPEKIAFKYKLEGLDNDWVDAGNLREARYNHLPSGKYRFRVIAANGDGVWNNKGNSLSLVFNPPFWRTAWFGCLLGLTIIGTVGGGVRYISIKKLQRQLASLEQQHAVEKERSRIAKDMHDDLGANLTQICILSELAKREAQQPARVAVHADAISDTAREVVQSMDEIVWAANPKNDNLRKLSGYIFQYAESFLAPTQIRARFDHPVSLPELPLSAEFRHNLFLVVKEALNNVAKHSRASEIWLRLALSNSELEIKIEDNGKGFSDETGRPFGNGLANMKKRIEDIDGRFEIFHMNGNGTKIKISVKIKS